MRRFIRFCMVGASGVFVDTGILFLLADPVMLGLPVTPSKLIATEVAIVNNFIWNDLWTFREASRSRDGLAARCVRFCKFNLIYLVGIVFNVILLNLLHRGVDMNLYLANLIAIGVVTGWNYYANVRFGWSVSGEPATPPRDD